MKGSPVKPALQLQIGLWLLTMHWELSPQTPGQGSLHFLLMHAWFVGHSVLTVHSGLHAGGLPINVGIQEQTACPFESRHWELGPQGDGLQTSLNVAGLKKFCKIHVKNSCTVWYFLLTYEIFVLRCRNWMDCQNSRIGMCKLGDDLILDKQHFDHMFLDKGSDILNEYTPYLRYNPS